MYQLGLTKSRREGVGRLQPLSRFAVDCLVPEIDLKTEEQRSSLKTRAKGVFGSRPERRRLFQQSDDGDWYDGLDSGRPDKREGSG